MTTFDDRENAFEAKFAHDAEMIFKAEVRRDKLVGLWAAGLLGKSGDAAEAYARDVVMADMEKPGSEDVVAKLADDLAGKASAEQIRAKLAEMLPVAKGQLVSEG
jgi:hypothetical protein